MQARPAPPSRQRGGFLASEPFAPCRPDHPHAFISPGICWRPWPLQLVLTSCFRRQSTGWNAGGSAVPPTQAVIPNPEKDRMTSARRAHGWSASVQPVDCGESRKLSSSAKAMGASRSRAK